MADQDVLKSASFKSTLERAFAHALSHLAGAQERPVGATVDLAELRRRFDRPLSHAGIDPVEVIDDLVRDAEGGIIDSNSGRFFGWVIGGTLPAALAADWLTSVWDQNAAIHACGPAAAVVEEIAGAWLKDLFGLPKTASFAFVTGTQMAHMTCLASARHRLLQRVGWNVEEQGLAGAPAIRILTSSERHGSIERAVRILGLGKSAIVALPCDDSGRLEPETLTRALETNARQPTIVLLQAGDLNIGAFDPFSDLIPIARKYDAWVHVDGAFGLWAAASPKYQHLLRGVGLADSWTNDGHKWLNTLPMPTRIAVPSRTVQATPCSWTTRATRSNGIRNGRAAVAVSQHMRHCGNWADLALPNWSSAAALTPMRS